MSEEAQKETELGNSILAILGGAGASFLTALALFPVMQLIADQFWELDLFNEKKGINLNDFIFFGSFFLYLFIAALAGGFICALICRSYEYTHALILTGIYLVLLLFSFGGSGDKRDVLTKFISLLFVGAGFLAGSRFIVLKRKRRKENQRLDL